MISRADLLCSGNSRYRRCDIIFAHLQVVGGIVPRDHRRTWSRGVRFHKSRPQPSFIEACQNSHVSSFLGQGHL
jgi:hypothetical protein